MLEMLYSLTIYPLELIMGVLLEGAHALSASYGIALIALSILVSLGVSPFYRLADRWQSEERELQGKMKGRIEDFKSVFSGYELHAYIKTLHRQHNYNPLLAMRSSFGLLIQIPFFIAAYQLLSDYTALNGASFVFIDNLGQSDALVKTPWGNVNLLPFVMTAANLGAAYFYGKGNALQDNLKIYAIALCFLVLLYSAPSGLLIYWTVNNLYGLIRSAVKPMNMRSIGFLRVLGGRPGDKISQLDDPSILVYLIVLGVSALGVALYGSDVLQATDTHLHGYVVSLLLVSIFNVYLLGRLLPFFSGGAGGAFKAILMMATLVAPILALSTLTLEVGAGQDLRLMSLVIAHVVLFLFFWRRVSDIFELKFSDSIPEIVARKLFVYGGSLLVFLVVLVAPIALMASGEAHDFPLEPFVYLRPLLATFSLLVIGVLIIQWNVSIAVLRFSGCVMSFLALVVMANQFVFVSDLGDMTNFIFEHGIQHDSLSVTLNIVGVVGIACVTTLLLSYRKPAWLVKFVSACCVASACLVILDVNTFLEKREGLVQEQRDKIEPVYTFSKEGRNVVVLVVDRLIGGYVEKALEERPELKQDLEGFVWYPKSLSGGAFTLTGVPAIAGGYDYSLDAINSTRDDVSLRKKIDESFRVLPYNLNKKGFESVLIDPPPRLFKSSNKEYMDGVSIKRPKGLYDEVWKEENKQVLAKERTYLKLVMFGLFRSSPKALQSWLYDDGEWLLSAPEVSLSERPNIPNSIPFTPTNGQRKAALENWAVMDYLPELSEVESGDKSRYYFMYNMLVHEPWAVDHDYKLDIGGRLQYPKSLVDSLDGDLFSAKHYYGTAAALVLIAEWTEWLKEHGVYDNTRLIVVSDHGRSVFNPMFSEQKVPLKQQEKRYSNQHLKKYELAWFHNALLMKDFGVRGDLKISNDFKTASDIPAMALAGIMDGVNPYTNNPIEEPMSKFPYRNAYLDWVVGKHEYSRFKVDQYYTVYNDDIFNVESWRGGEDLDIELAEKNNLSLGYAVNISDVNDGMVDAGNAFSFKVDASHPVEVSLTIQSFYYPEKNKSLILEGNSGFYQLAAESFFPGVNNVQVDISLDGGQYHRVKNHNVFYSDGGVALLPILDMVGKQGWGELRKNRSADGGDLSVAEKHYSYGAGTHSDSEYSFHAKKQYSELFVAFGLSDYAVCGDGKAQFRVLADGNVLVDKVLKRGELSKHIFDIRDVDNIAFITEKVVNTRCDHTNWLNLQLTKASQ